MSAHVPATFMIARTDNCVRVPVLQVISCNPCRQYFYSARLIPEPPISLGTSFILGIPSCMCSTVSW